MADDSVSGLRILINAVGALKADEQLDIFIAPGAKPVGVVMFKIEVHASSPADCESMQSQHPQSAPHINRFSC
jgi:hypothetical protein